MTPTYKMTPTVGRIVWYVPLEQERFIGDDGKDRWPALVCYVWNPQMVNLAVIDPNGALKPHTSVVLAAEDAEALPGQCEWMPYQKGQAAHAESLLKRLKGEAEAAMSGAEALLKPDVV